MLHLELLQNTWSIIRSIQLKELGNNISHAQLKKFCKDSSPLLHRIPFNLKFEIFLSPVWQVLLIYSTRNEKLVAAFSLLC